MAVPMLIPQAEARQCRGCGVLKPPSEYHRKVSAKDGRQDRCKECRAGYLREHYRANKGIYLEATRRSRQRREALIREIKSRPCADCGGTFPYYVMDFDHREGKRFTISRPPAKYGSLADLMAEMAKCDVVCANCHRVRTFKRIKGAIFKTERLPSSVDRASRS